MRRTLVTVLALVLVAAACSGSSDDDATTTTDGGQPNGSTTSSSSTTSTLAEPATGIRIDGLTGSLEAAVQNVYERAKGLGDPSVLPLRLNAALEMATPATDVLLASAATGDILGSEVAVITADDDVLLAVDSADGWEIVGFRLPSLGIPAIYGPPARLVMIIGSDARPGQDAAEARADSLHIVATEPASGAGAIVGIPRDAWVEDPQGRNRKFTDILALQGPDAVLASARDVSDLELEGYLLTGFAGFVDLIDAFGEFTIDIPMNMANAASQAYFTAGVQEIDGADALALARNRTIPGGDFTRQLHGGVIISWMARAVQEGGIETLPHLLELLTEHTITDLDAEELLTLTAAAFEIDPATTPNIVVPGNVGTAGSASVVFLTDEAFEIFADLEDGALAGR